MATITLKENRKYDTSCLLKKISNQTGNKIVLMDSCNNEYDSIHITFKILNNIDDIIDFLKKEILKCEEKMPEHIGLESDYDDFFIAPNIIMVKGFGNGIHINYKIYGIDNEDFTKIIGIIKPLYNKINKKLINNLI